MAEDIRASLTLSVGGAPAHDGGVDSNGIGGIGSVGTAAGDEVTGLLSTDLTSSNLAGAHADVILHTADGRAVLLHDVPVTITADFPPSAAVDCATDTIFPPSAGHHSPVDCGVAGSGVAPLMAQSAGGRDDAASFSPSPDTSRVSNLDSLAPAPTLSRTAIISLDSPSPEAETLFRSAIVSLDAIPGNEVQGISPLYHVTHFDAPDAMSAVVQLTTHLGARELIGALGAIEAAHADQVDLDLVDMPGVTSDESDCRVPWPSAREHASVLAPWLDMDPDARLGGDPVSFLLAMAPDAGLVGMLSADWVLGSDAGGSA